MVKEYHQSNSVAEVLRRFRLQYPGVRCPSRATVCKNVNKYEATGTSRNLNKEGSGLRRTGRSAANIAAVRNLLGQHEGLGISSCRNGLHLPHATFNRITQLDFHYHPYQNSATSFCQGIQSDDDISVNGSLGKITTSLMTSSLVMNLGLH